MPKKGGMPQNLKPFKKGENGGGHRKPGKTLRTILQQLLNQDFKKFNPLTNKEEKLALKEWLNIVLIAQGLGGDVKALKMIYEQIEGKIPEVVNIEGDISLQMKIVKQKVKAKRAKNISNNENDN